MLGGKEKSAGVPLVFGPRAAKGTPPAIEACLHGRVLCNHREEENNAFFFFSEKKKKELKNVRIWTMRFHSKRSASNNNNKSPNDAAIGLVRSRRFV